MADVTATTTITASVKHLLFTAADSLGLVPTEKAIRWHQQITAAATAPPPRSVIHHAAAAAHLFRKEYAAI